MADLQGQDAPDNATVENTIANQQDDSAAIIAELRKEVATLNGKKEHLEHKYERDVVNATEKKEVVEQPAPTNNSANIQDYVSEQIFVSQHKEVDADVLSIMKKIKVDNQSFEDVFNSVPIQALVNANKEKADDKNATPNSTLGNSQPSGSGESDIAAKFKAKLNARGINI